MTVVITVTIMLLQQMLVSTCRFHGETDPRNRCVLRFSALIQPIQYSDLQGLPNQ